MRITLETIEKIERYLLRSMTPEEVLAFEKEIASNSELQQAVEQQKNLIKGMEKVHLKNAALKAGQKVRMYSILKAGGIIVTVLVVLTVAYFGYQAIKKNSDKHQNKIEQNIVIPDIEKGKVYDPGKFIPSQYFEIDGSKDTVIAGNNGIMFAIPAGSFVDDSNNPVKGKIKVELKEALDPATIMLSGLSTFSNDQPLETGGMFYLNASANGKDLKIGGDGILSSVPQAESKPGMMIFDGVVQTDGSINWVNPKPTETFLLPIDMSALDFYPEGYVDKLKELELNPGSLGQPQVGYNGDTLMVDTGKEDVVHGSEIASDNGPENVGFNYERKKYRDSLFLSFTSELKHGMSAVTSDGGYIALYDSEGRIVFECTNCVPEDSLAAYNLERWSSNGISPAKVLAFWQPSFNNTYLATKEFEQRMKLIYKTCITEVLDIYVDNIDMKLYQVDSMAALASGEWYSEFYKFAALKQVGVANGNKKYDLLKRFYQKQSSIYAQTAIVTTRKFFEKNQRADVFAAQANAQFTNIERNREAKLYQQEFDLNLKEAYRQLDYQPQKVRFGGNVTATITTTGWKNVDAYVAESLIARTTLDYTDTNGRKAVIVYKSMDITIANENDFDLINVYLIPDKLTTYMKVNKKEGKYTESLNELITYDVFAVGYKNKQVFYQLEKAVKPSSYSLLLASSDIQTVNNVLGLLRGGAGQSDLKQAINYSVFQLADAERKNRYKKVVADREKLRPVVFPCGNFWPSDTVATDSTTTYTAR